VPCQDRLSQRHEPIPACRSRPVDVHPVDLEPDIAGGGGVRGRNPVGDGTDVLLDRQVHRAGGDLGFVRGGEDLFTVDVAGDVVGLPFRSVIVPPGEVPVLGGGVLAVVAAVVNGEVVDRPGEVWFVDQAMPAEESPWLLMVITPSDTPMFFGLCLPTLPVVRPV
jgi:hypothetical protein